MLSVTGNPSLTSCWFSGNSTCLLGGGLYVRDGEAVVVGCTFLGNRATNLAYGGGVATELSDVTFRNCLFVGNQADRGGGLYNRDSHSIVSNCTFSEHSSLEGRAVACDSNGEPSNVDLTNCILWDSGNETWKGGDSTIEITYSDVHGGYLGEGCVYLDPEFVRIPHFGLDGIWGTADDDYGDLRLGPGSPCIKTGDPNFTPEPGETDLDGHFRLLCAIVDMGAYEFGIGDHDCDSEVDLDDFSSCFSCITGPAGDPYIEGCQICDFDYDLDVDLFDLTGFQKAFTLK